LGYEGREGMTEADPHSERFVGVGALVADAVD
jgi:hypothetical protein